VEILLVDNTQADRTLLERTIVGLGHKVQIARNGAEALEAIAASSPDVVLTEWTMPETSGEALTRAIRDLDNQKYTYVVIVTGQTTLDVVRAAFSAGADDYLSKPAHRDELAARLRAAERIVKLETRLRQRVHELESALRRLEISAAMKGGVVSAALPLAPAMTQADREPPPGGLAQKAPFAVIEDTLRAALTEFLGGQFQRSDSVIAAPAFDTQITLTAVELGLEITLGFSVDRAGAEAIATLLLGAAEDDDMLKDLMGEIANTVMGAVKASFSAAGETLTAGIPSSGTGDLIAKLADTHAWRRQVVLASSDATIATVIAVRERPTVELRCKDLLEGMVLAKPVKNDNGSLLVAGGTRITATLADRLHRIAPNVKVRVIDSAA
jgi:CheY-like chemotaxis protein